MYTIIEAPDRFSPHILEIDDIIKVHINDCLWMYRQYVISPVRLVGPHTFPKHTQITVWL